MARTRSYGTRFGFQSGNLPYRYELVPFTWQAVGNPPHWRLPASAVGGVDLRPLPAQALAGGAPQGFAFVAARQSPGGTALATSFHMNDTPATAGMRSAWQSAMGYSPQGDWLTDLLWDQLTTGADPSGEAGPKPLMPGTDGQLRLYVGGHSLVRSEAFRFGVHPHTNRVRDVLRLDFERLWERTNGHDHCRRVLDFTRKKYRADWREFVPTRLLPHVPGPLPHATTITESFTGTGDPMGADLTWTEIQGDFDRSGGTCVTAAVAGATGRATGRADSDLSSDDHYAQAVFAASTSNQGVMCRFDSASTADADETYYIVHAPFPTSLQLYKRVIGGFTQLGGNAGVSSVETQIVKVQADGSTITTYRAGVGVHSETDSAITGHVRGGLYSASTFNTFDDFEAADLAAGGGFVAFPRPRGLYAGMSVLSGGM